MSCLADTYGGVNNLLIKVRLTLDENVESETPDLVTRNVHITQRTVIKCCCGKYMCNLSAHAQDYLKQDGSKNTEEILEIPLQVYYKIKEQIVILDTLHIIIGFIINP